MSMHQETSDIVLEYISQANNFYTVKSDSGKTLTLPKASNKITAIVSSDHYDFHDKWAKIAAIGLALGGILTIFFSPLVIFENIELLKNKNLTTTERIHAKNLIVISTVCLLLGIVFFSLFIMHLIY